MDEKIVMTGSDDRPARIPVVEVVVTHDLDRWSASELRERLADALQLRPARLVVNLAACRYIDAAGIGMLLQVHRHACQNGARLTLRSPSPRLLRNLALARVDGVLDVMTDDTGAADPDHADDPDAAPGRHAS